MDHSDQGLTRQLSVSLLGSLQPCLWTWTPKRYRPLHKALVRPKENRASASHAQAQSSGQRKRADQKAKRRATDQQGVRAMVAGVLEHQGIEAEDWEPRCGFPLFPCTGGCDSNREDDRKNSATAPRSYGHPERLPSIDIQCSSRLAVNGLQADRQHITIASAWKTNRAS